MDSIDSLEADELTGEPSLLAMETLNKTLKAWFGMDSDHSNAWRAQARADFDFVAGDQWSPEDRRRLEEQGRPVITFNRTIAIIKSVAGIEINGRHDTVYLPRGMEPGEIVINETLTAASQWMADTSDAEDEQSEAFQDAIVCGMGWTEQRISYDDDPDGMYVEARVDPLEMYWDRSARSKNLKDARRVFRLRKMTLDEARDFARSLGVVDPQDEDLDAGWAYGGVTEPGKSVEEKRHRDQDSGGKDPMAEVLIVHAQWIERKPFYRVADKTTDQEYEMDEKQFSEYEELMAHHGLEYSYARQTRKVYKQAFLGRDILGGVMDGAAPDRFTFQCITGEKHRNKGCWFGLIALMRDPQMWANKWLSQVLHILNTTAKGGILAEKDAFEDPREALDTYAQPDAITFTAPGAIQKGKITQKPGGGIPAGYQQLLEFAINSIRDSVGVNQELLGMRDANQPGVLEAQRKQSAMTILATLFDSLRGFRRNVGRVRMHFIQKYLSDGRLIRITKDDKFLAVPLLRDKTAGDYEVIIDDAPTSPNQKQETWWFLMQLMPVFKDVLTPDAALLMLEYSPLPSKLIEQFKAMAEEASQPSPEQMEAQQIGRAAELAKIGRDEASAEKDRAAAAGQRAGAILDLAAATEKGAQAQLAEAQRALAQRVAGGVMPAADSYAPTAPSAGPGHPAMQLRPLGMPGLNPDAMPPPEAIAPGRPDPDQLRQFLAGIPTRGQL